VSWKGAREASDFASFAPALTEMMSLKREVATATRPELCATEPYDGALDQFERGMTSKRLDEIFGATRERLAPLLASVLAKKKASPDVDALHPTLAFDHPGWTGSAEAQAKLAERVAKDLGFGRGPRAVVCLDARRGEPSSYPSRASTGSPPRRL